MRPLAQEKRRLLSLAVALINENDEGFHDWPIGLDSGLSDHNSIFVSGVFCRTAVMVLAREFAHMVPVAFDLYHFPAECGDRGTKAFFPKVGFHTCGDAILTTVGASVDLAVAHENWARERSSSSPLTFVRNELLLP